MKDQPGQPPADEGDDGQPADERRGEMPPSAATPAERLVGEPLRRLARQNGRQVEP